MDHDHQPAGLWGEKNSHLWLSRDYGAAIWRGNGKMAFKWTDKFTKRIPFIRVALHFVFGCVSREILIEAIHDTRFANSWQKFSPISMVHLLCLIIEKIVHRLGHPGKSACSWKFTGAENCSRALFKITMHEGNLDAAKNEKLQKNREKLLITFLDDEARHKVTVL